MENVLSITTIFTIKDKYGFVIDLMKQTYKNHAPFFYIEKNYTPCPTKAETSSYNIQDIIDYYIKSISFAEQNIKEDEVHKFFLSKKRKVLKKLKEVKQKL